MLLLVPAVFAQARSRLKFQVCFDKLRGALHQSSLLHTDSLLKSSLRYEQLCQPQQQQLWQQQQQRHQSSAAAARPAGDHAALQEHPSKEHRTTTQGHQSGVRFSDLNISGTTKRALAEVFKYELCTKVQAESMPVCLTGHDVLVKAKTGTGKTLAFMIPVIERLLRDPPPAGQLGALVLSPTRELAMQIQQETAKLLRFHPKLNAQVAIGGNNINTEAARLREQAPSILIATPQRVLRHLTAGTVVASKLRMLVCDEADTLLDMGFRPTLKSIFALLPAAAQRQSLLFSATFPRDVKDLAELALRKEYTAVDCVKEETHTNVQVQQYSCVVPHAQLIETLHAAITKNMAQDANYKVLVFFPTARQTQFYSEVFSHLGFPVLEMHSRKSQPYRTGVSDKFRAGSNLIMFSSDVSARGVDYPGVSLVVQVGVPQNKAQYVHRIGRTARAGKAGEGLLILADFEAPFLKTISDLPVTKVEAPVQSSAAPIQAALQKVSDACKEAAYKAWLGFYSNQPLPKPEMVQLANDFSRLMGCVEPPEVDKIFVGRVGLRGVPGLRIRSARAAHV